jgi:hypothetical protein
VGDLSRPVVGRGATAADIDSDGDVDLLITTNGGSPRLLRNDQRTGHHWLRVRLLSAGGNTAAIGARIAVEAAGVRQSRMVMPTKSYLSQVELPVVFGLGDHNGEVSVSVTWPDGSEQNVGPLAVDRVVEVVHGGD